MAGRREREVHLESGDMESSSRSDVLFVSLWGLELAFNPR